MENTESTIIPSNYYQNMIHNATPYPNGYGVMENYAPLPPPTQHGMPHQQWYPIQHWMSLNSLYRMNSTICDPSIGHTASTSASLIWRGRGRFKRNNQNRYSPVKKGNKNNDIFITKGVKFTSTATNKHNKAGDKGLSAEGDYYGKTQIEVVKTSKRKTMSTFFSSKPWNKQDAEKALWVELEYYKKQATTLIIKFPDPDITTDTIKSFHSKIDKVHFQVPIQPRHCFVQLADDSDVQSVIDDLNNVNFCNLGKLKVGKKTEKTGKNITPEMIDPYTLYVGNLLHTITVDVVKQKFPTACKISIGFSPRLKFTRYAFVRYQTVEESIEAFKSTHNTVLNDRTLIVRFRRLKKDLTKEDTLQMKELQKIKTKTSQQVQELNNNMQKLYENTIKKEKEHDSSLGIADIFNFQLRDIINGFNFDQIDQISDEDEKEVNDEDDDEDDDEYYNYNEDMELNINKDFNDVEDDDGGVDEKGEE